MENGGKFPEGSALVHKTLDVRAQMMSREPSNWSGLPFLPISNSFTCFSGDLSCSIIWDIMPFLFILVKFL